MPTEGEDGIRVRPMSDSANEGRPKLLAAPPGMYAPIKDVDEMMDELGI
jgi:hypothetical protein